MNSSEKIIFDMLTKRGFTVLRNGWPDFLCWREVVKNPMRTLGDGRYFPTARGLMAVEVKTGKDKLSEAQKTIHNLLRAAHIPVYVIRPEEFNKTSSQTLKVRHFLTNQEMRNMEAAAEHAKDKIAELEKKIVEMHEHISDLNQKIEESSEVLQAAEYALDNVQEVEEREHHEAAAAAIFRLGPNSESV